MFQNFKLGEDTIYLLNNKNVESFITREKITTACGKDKNEYSISIITDKQLGGVGIFLMEKINTKFNRYLIYKRESTGFQEARLSSDQALEELQLNHQKGEMSIGMDISSGKYQVDVIDKWMHTAVFGITNSGKTVTIKWLMYQIAKYKYSEFILLGKGDLLALKDSKKVRYANSVKSVNKAEFMALINYIWLNVADREIKLNNVGYAGNYEEYKKNVMMKDPSALQIPHLVIVFDEFEALRENVSGELAGGSTEFDKRLKTIANYVRAYGILLYFGSQNYIKEEIGIMRDYTSNQLIGFSKNVQRQYVDTDVSNLKKAMNGTYLFYSAKKNKFIKIPFDDPLEINKKIIQASEENLLFKDNPEYYKRYEYTYEMINDLIFKVDSDIFNFSKDIYKYFMLEGSFNKLLKTPEYIPFSILLYSIFQNLEPEVNIGPNVSVYPNKEFSKDIDKSLFTDNKEFYMQKGKSGLIDGIKNLYKEGAQDKAEFIQNIHDVLLSYVKTITGTTDLSNIFEKKTDDEEPSSVDKVMQHHEDEKQQSKDEEYLLTKATYTGEIKPASFNGMYYVSKSGDIKSSYEAKKYKETIKTKLLNKMNATQQKQVRTPVLLDLEFTLGLSVKKDGELSKIGRNDLDNLLKATIDGISGTIMNDDKQVFGIRTKINYIEKHSSVHKNNKVEIKVFDFNKDTILKYRNIYEGEKKITPLMDLRIAKNSKISVPTVNSMYFIDSNNKKRLSSNALSYKTLLRNQTIEYIQKHNITRTNKDILLYIEFHIPNVIERDLDNMLKATIDAFKNTFMEDDNQVREIMCFKSPLQNKESFSSRIKVQGYIYNPLKDLAIEEAEGDIIIPEEMGDYFKTDNIDNTDNINETFQNKNNLVNKNININNSTLMFNNIINEENPNIIEDEYNNENIIDIKETENIIGKANDISNENIEEIDNKTENNNNDYLEEIIEKEIEEEIEEEYDINKEMADAEAEFINSINLEENKEEEIIIENIEKQLESSKGKDINIMDKPQIDEVNSDINIQTEHFIPDEVDKDETGFEEKFALGEEDFDKEIGMEEIKIVEVEDDDIFDFVKEVKK